ncbi:hypothetical protein HD806DRAFT_9163 [Xylariaceae sp. AK1471]|nr:hypothetical protein HD806DRAFT_9163 [Xylariaceae sp. AK1471]
MLSSSFSPPHLMGAQSRRDELDPDQNLMSLADDGPLHLGPEVPVQSFHTYPFLPPELRAEICGYAAITPEFVHLKYDVLPVHGPLNVVTQVYVEPQSPPLGLRPWITCPNLQKIGGMLRASRDLRAYAELSGQFSPSQITYDWSKWATRILEATQSEKEGPLAIIYKDRDGFTATFTEILGRIASASNGFEPFMVKIEDTMTVLRLQPLNDIFFLDGYLTTIATMPEPCLTCVNTQSLRTVSHVLVTLDDAYTAMSTCARRPPRISHDTQQSCLRDDTRIAYMVKLLEPLLAATSKLTQLLILIGPWQSDRLPKDLTITQPYTSGATEDAETYPLTQGYQSNTSSFSRSQLREGICSVSPAFATTTTALGSGFTVDPRHRHMMDFVEGELRYLGTELPRAKARWLSSPDGRMWMANRRAHVLVDDIQPPEWFAAKFSAKWAFVRFT